MPPTLFEQQTYERIDYTLTPIEEGEYEQCEFIGCNFTDSDLSGIRFIDCTFTSCNLSMARVTNTSMQNIRFSGCKLHGIQWRDCSAFLFEVHFDNCLLNFSSFFRLKMEKTEFLDCDLEECDFTESNLKGSNFSGSSLVKSIFQNTNLESCDLTTATGYALDADVNQIRGAQFSLLGIPGLLAKYDILIR